MTATLAMTQLFDIGGAYPQRGEGNAIDTLAMVHSFAANAEAYGALPSAGQLLPIDRNQALMSVIGTSYGGDGVRTIGLPDLRGRTMIGGGPQQPPIGESVPVTYMIAASAPTDYPLLGAIGQFCGNYAPAGWLAADGSTMPISQNVVLFEVIGTAFGGNPEVYFMLPDIGQRAAIGAGAGPGLAPVALGETVPAGSNGVPGLGLNYLISLAGNYPPDEGNGGFPPSDPTLGEVIAYAGATVPAGWALCDGTLLPVAGNKALFALIGTTYGGDGQEDFALPDLRGQMLTGPPR